MCFMTVLLSILRFSNCFDHLRAHVKFFVCVDSFAHEEGIRF